MNFDSRPDFSISFFLMCWLIESPLYQERRLLELFMFLDTAYVKGHLRESQLEKIQEVGFRPPNTNLFGRNYPKIYEFKCFCLD
jgi:hypothetical protein